MAEGDRRGLALILLPWLALPLVAGAYLAAWERLPERVAVKFDWSGAAAEWMSRGALLGLEAGVLLFVLAQYTFKLLREPSPGDSRWVVVSYYAVVVFVAAVFLGILVYNLP